MPRAADLAQVALLALVGQGEAADLARGGNHVSQLVQSPETLNNLKTTNPALHEGIIVAYSHAIDRVFLIAVPIALLSVVAACFIRPTKLRETSGIATESTPPVSATH